jgi:hypothetical protein
MKVIKNPRIWEFDVDDTLIMWNKSQYLGSPVKKVGKAKITPNQPNINLLIKLSKIGWFIHVHSGSGVEWAVKAVKALGIEKYVNLCSAKALGITDDNPHDGYAYKCFRKY